MKRSSLSLALSLLLVFASGIAAGFFGRGYYESTTVKAATVRPRTPEDYRKAYVEEMSKRLALSQTQKVKLDEILDETRAKYREVRERHRPEMKAIQDEQVDKVNGMLTEPQRAEYAKMRAEREAKRKADEKGREPKSTSSSR
jgi:hypothetical protein